MPFVVFIHRRWDLLLLGVVGIAVLVLFGEVLGLDFITNRAGEFDDPNSSGFARFVGGFYMFEEMLWPNLPRALFGYGAGAFMDYVHLFTIEVADMPVTKMIFEFGLVGAFTYFAFIFSSLFSSPLPRMLSVAIAITFLLNGMYVPFSHGLALGLLVLTSTRKVQLVTSNVPARTTRLHAGLRNDDVTRTHPAGAGGDLPGVGPASVRHLSAVAEPDEEAVATSRQAAAGAQATHRLHDLHVRLQRGRRDPREAAEPAGAQDSAEPGLEILIYVDAASDQTAKRLRAWRAAHQLSRFARPAWQDLWHEPAGEPRHG